MCIRDSFFLTAWTGTPFQVDVIAVVSANRRRQSYAIGGDLCVVQHDDDKERSVTEIFKAETPILRNSLTAENTAVARIEDHLKTHRLQSRGLAFINFEITIELPLIH